MRRTSWANQAWRLCALASALGWGACTQLHHQGPQDGTETGNPPVVSPKLNEALVALVISADQVRVTGQAGAASPAGATVEVVSALTGAVFQGPVAADGSFDVSVSGSKLDTFEVRVVTEGEESSNRVYVVPGAAAVASGSDGSLSCEQRENLALQQLEAVVAQAPKRCRIDSDCTEVSTGSACNDSCSRHAVSKVDAMELDAARAAIEGGLCKSFTQDGCRVIAQPCVPIPGEVVCASGVRCVLVTPEPDGACPAKPVCVDGARQEWPQVCSVSVTPIPSAARYPACIADDRGNVALTTMGGSMALTNKGWSSSGYGEIPNTLSPDAQLRCDAQFAALGAGASALDDCLNSAP